MTTLTLRGTNPVAVQAAVDRLAARSMLATVSYSWPIPVRDADGCVREHMAIVELHSGPRR